MLENIYINLHLKASECHLKSFPSVLLKPTDVDKSLN